MGQSPGMQLPIYQIDAFTSEVFKGNPAAVVPLETWLPDALLQNIALENNLSETAFIVPVENGFHLRWFTPADEVALCGHATLATAYYLFEIAGYDQNPVRFETLSGDLFVHKTKNGFRLDFPVWTFEEIENDPRVTRALQGLPYKLFKGTDWMAVLEDERAVKNLSPDMDAIRSIHELRGLIVTARGAGAETDFVSRYFAPELDVPEDPVTGSAHCMLTPYWAEQLGKRILNARQISRRGGEILCELKDDRVLMSGQAALYMQGTIYV